MFLVIDSAMSATSKRDLEPAQEESISSFRWSELFESTFQRTTIILAGWMVDGGSFIECKSFGVASSIVGHRQSASNNSSKCHCSKFFGSRVLGPSPVKLESDIQIEDVRNGALEQLSMEDCFQPSDVTACRVISLGGLVELFCTTAETKLGVLQGTSKTLGQFI